MDVWLIIVHASCGLLQLYVGIAKQDTRHPGDEEEGKIHHFRDQFSLLWVIFVYVTVQAFQNPQIDVCKKAWLQGQVDLFLDRGDPTVCRVTQAFQLLKL